MISQTVVLLVLDGWGIGRKDFSNPIHIAKPKNIGLIKANYLAGAIQASGIAIGLPWNEEGNSEVGHLTLGAGKTIYQHYPRITLSIERGDFFKNQVLLKVCEHAKKFNSALNLVGLLSEGNVHASLEHVKALLKLAKDNSVARVNLHLFSDGKDSGIKSLPALLVKLKTFIKEIGVGSITSVSGRYYAMDRDEHWDRTEKTYLALTGQLKATLDWETKIKESYERGLTDEFIEPMVTASGIKNNDAVIFFNFREDSIRQIASTLILENFDKFPRVKLENLYLATMTNYSEKFKVSVISPAERVDNPLGKILAENNKVQLRLAETEKYAHVTYFFNGYREKPFPSEYRILIASKNVSRPDDAPEMMVKEITERLLEAMSEKSFDFILVNFANPDIIAHTGNYDAGLQAIMAVDESIGKIMNAAKEANAALLITSDHGNIERMVDPYTGRVETSHDPSLVPIYLVGERFKSPKNESGIEQSEAEAIGILSDVGPTILEIMDIPKPADMTGQSLLKLLK